jgi:hypothetical protein
VRVRPEGAPPKKRRSAVRSFFGRDERRFASPQEEH